MQTTNNSEKSIPGVLILRSYYEAIKDLEQADQLEMVMGLMKYGFEGLEPEFSKPYLKGYWKLIEPTLKGTIARYQSSVENGKKGGRPKKAPPAPQNDNKMIEDAGATFTSETDEADTPTLGIFPEQENEFTRMFEKDESRTQGYSFEAMMQLTEDEEDLRRAAEVKFRNDKPDENYLSQSYYYVVKDNSRLMEKYRAIYSKVHKKRDGRLKHQKDESRTLE